MQNSTSIQTNNPINNPLVPPQFTLSASHFLYDPGLPDCLFRTYARITGLA